jgi:NAD(P)-dependent dehydrogenase (short-subunit alcohol dehydrogenase family)
MLITGGNRGLGQALCDRFSGTSVSRSSGHDIACDSDDIARLSLEHEVFINNAYDGIYGLISGEFAQVKLLSRVAALWKQHNKRGHIINIGGVACVTQDPPGDHGDLYAANKAALRHHSHQWSRAFKNNVATFKTTLINIDRLDTPLGRLSPEWNGNGHALSDIGDMISLCLSMPHSVCIEEITAWVNVDHKQ